MEFLLFAPTLPPATLPPFIDQVISVSQAIAILTEAPFADAPDDSVLIEQALHLLPYFPR